MMHLGDPPGGGGGPGTGQHCRQAGALACAARASCSWSAGCAAPAGCPGRAGAPGWGSGAADPALEGCGRRQKAQQHPTLQTHTHHGTLVQCRARAEQPGVHPRRSHVEGGCAGTADAMPAAMPAPTALAGRQG
jgi:hypothetical protein